MTTMVNDHRRPLPTNLLHPPAERPAPLPLDLDEADAMPEPGRSLSLDALDELSRMIEAPGRPSPAGAHAAELMVKHFETLAADAERMAQDRVDQANALQQEVRTWATVLRDAGQVLASKMEADSARLFHASKVIRETQALLSRGAVEPG